MTESQRSMYQCRRCGKWFLAGNVSCAVNHGPDQCCHYGDEQMEGPK